MFLRTGFETGSTVDPASIARVSFDVLVMMVMDLKSCLYSVNTNEIGKAFCDRKLRFVCW